MELTPDEYPHVDVEAGTALIIDDNGSLRDAVRTYLGEGNLFSRFFEAQNGLEGFKLLVNHPNEIDLVICDIEMPEFDGFKFLQMHATREDFQAVPVIVVTSRSEKESRIRGLELGAVDYLSKPVFKEELRLRARHQLHIRRLQAALRAAIRQLQQIAKTDPLTNLPNRRHFVETLAGEFRRAVRYRNELAVLIMDIDDFKAVNDTYGHLVGDQVLQRVAQILEQGLRQSDLAARFGGEEFAVLLPETPLEAAQLVAERYRRTIAEQRFEADGKHFGITISIGVGTYLETMSQNLDELLRRTDIALYRAKAGGKDRVEVVSPTDESRA